MMLLETIRARGKLGVARALTRLETDPHGDDTAALLDAAFAAPKGVALGLTGPPGVGKSTLTNALIREFRARGLTVAIIAIDPSSRATGGALLGDRTRIDADPDDTGIFMRSMAARSRLGGLADITFPAMILLRALYDIVLIETVGVGQSETEIVQAADLVVFCAQPGSGDALQFMKAGVLEIPDVIFVTKGDMGQIARRAAADLKGALSLNASGVEPPVAVISSLTGDGIPEAVSLLIEQTDKRRTQVGWTDNRMAQVRAWLEAELRAAYGTVGLEAVSDALMRGGRLFSQARAAHDTLASIFARGLSEKTAR